MKDESDKRHEFRKKKKFIEQEMLVSIFSTADV